MTTASTFLAAAEGRRSDDVHESTHPVEDHRQELDGHHDDEETEEEEADGLDVDEAATDEARQTYGQTASALLNL